MTLASSSSTANHPHTAALILARGGSVGIPLKNIVPLGGRPLISWALDAILQTGDAVFDSVWVSTDHADIASAARDHGGRVGVFWRSARHARADSPSVAAVAEFMRARPEVDVVCLVQCTSPFVRPEFVASAHRLLAEGDHDSVFSVTRVKKFRWREVSQDKPGPTQALNFDPAARPRRQDWKGDLVENGMFYFARRHLVEKGVLQGGKCSYVEVPNEYSLEIDSPLDLAFAESVLARVPDTLSLLATGENSVNHR